MEEILGARDKELNQWASIKKASQYRTDEEERYDLKAFEGKAKNTFKKKQVLKSFYEEEEKEEGNEEGERGEEEGDKKKKETGDVIEDKPATAVAAESHVRAPTSRP